MILQRPQLLEQLVQWVWVFRMDTEKRPNKNLIERYLEKEGAGKRLWGSLYLALALSVLAALYVQYGLHGHPNFDFEEIPAFYALFGLASTALLYFGAKFYGKFMAVDEDYYSKDYKDYFVKDEDADEERVAKIMDSVSDNRNGGGEE